MVCCREKLPDDVTNSKYRYLEDIHELIRDLEGNLNLKCIYVCLFIRNLVCTRRKIKERKKDERNHTARYPTFPPLLYLHIIFARSSTFTCQRVEFVIKLSNPRVIVVDKRNTRQYVYRYLTYTMYMYDAPKYISFYYLCLQHE